jgi:uncharacterized protein YecT (DUF1311 family)
MKPLCVFSFLLCTTTALAGPLEECTAKASGSQGETACYAAESVRLNAELHAKHEAMLKTLAEDLRAEGVDETKIRWLKNKAQEAQNLWQKYRATYCGEFMYESTNGSGASSAATHCTIELTKHRLEELEHY